MQLSGKHAVRGRPEEIFERLQDPRIIAKCMPGCEELVLAPDGTYDARLSYGFGPLRGSFTGKVILRDVVPPRSYTLQVHGEGKAGLVNGVTRVRLEPLPNPDWTEIQFESDFQVGGLLGALGGRFLPGVARNLSEQFFCSLEKALRPEQP